MSTKRESEKIAPAPIEEERLRHPRPPTASSTPALSEHHQSVDKALDETKENIKRSIEEARKEIPRNTQAINDYQEQSLQATMEITDSYLDSQREIIKSFQSIWIPYVENTYGIFWHNWVSPQRIAELYARSVSSYADNAVTTAKISNNAMIANMEAFRTFIQREKEDTKELSKIGLNAAKTFERTSKEISKEYDSRGGAGTKT